MVTEDEKAQIRLCMDALREGIEGFRSRRPQLEMIATVATTLAACRGEEDPPADGEHIAVVEAGTGTGKSFGALVPALVMARSRGRRLVVSSSTVALQHQYAEKDSPTLQRSIPFGFTFASGTWINEAGGRVLLEGADSFVNFGVTWLVLLTLAAGSFGPLFYLVMREVRLGARKPASA